MNLSKPRTDIIDNAFDSGLRKYGERQAVVAMTEFLVTGNARGITRDNNAREEASSLLYSDSFHILADYTLSSYGLDKKPFTVTQEDVVRASLPNDPIYASSPKKYTDDEYKQIFILALAENPFYALNVLGMNSEMKTSLAVSLVTERYVEGKRKELDATNPMIITNRQKLWDISKVKLNRSCAEMKRQDLEMMGIDYTEDNPGMKM